MHDKSILGCTHGRKYRDISAIYRRNIMYRWVSTRYFMEKYRSGDISGFLARNRLFSRYIGDLAINRRFFGDISRGQRATVMLQSLLQCLTFICCWEDLNPKPKGLGFTRLPPGLSCPLIYKMQQLYIYLNSLYKENLRIFLRAN